MTGPLSPIIPPEIASHILEGVDTCDGILRNFFVCLQINDIEPFCEDEIAKVLRQRLLESEHKLGLSMPIDDAKDRATQLQSEVTSLESMNLKPWIMENLMKNAWQLVWEVSARFE
ncbi:hypothetical protein MKX01_030160 [Papaver californicum]|nr:hypothetical protein MKX01_030160 [Papaver californicum]